MTLELELPDLPPEDDEAVERHRGVKKYVHYIVDAWFRTPARIAGTVLLIIGCLGLISWNLSRLSILDELVALEVTEYQLDAQLSDLQFELAGIDVESLKAAIAAENNKVFQGFPELAAWAEGLARAAQSRDMVFSYKAEQPHRSPVPDVLEVPVVLEFKASGDAADSLFNKSMDLIGYILRDHWHIDVVATSARGTGDALVSVSMRAQVWVRDRYGFVDVATLAPAQIMDSNLNLDDE